MNTREPDSQDRTTSIFKCRECGEPTVVTGVTCSNCVGRECEDVNQALHACELNARVQAALPGQKYAKPTVVIPQEAWDRLVRSLKEEFEPS